MFLIKKSNVLDNAVDICGITDFNLTHIFECGQCFRWNPYNKGYIGCAGNHAAEVYYEAEENNVLTIKSIGEPINVDFWLNYFDLRRDYGKIKEELHKKDRFLQHAVEYGYGIRILNQDIYETLISFIISANNNIPRIKGCIEKLAFNFGNIISEGIYSFPTPETIAALSSDEISECCHAGYRCGYIEKSSKLFITKNPSISELIKMKRDEARKSLLEYSGVGPKVADCILLFSGIHCDSFPTDVWIKRVMEELYFQKEVSLKDIENFAHSYFGEYAGFAQQYLFYYAREHMDELRNIL